MDETTNAHPGTEHQKHLKWKTQDVGGEFTPASKQNSAGITGLSIYSDCILGELSRFKIDRHWSMSKNNVVTYPKREMFLWCFTNIS